MPEKQWAEFRVTRSRVAWAALWLILPLCLAIGASSGGAASEAEIKAAMVFNFTRFIEWTGQKADARQPLIIAVAGDDPLSDALEELARERAGGRPVQARRISQPAEAETAHLLFVGKRWKKRSAEFTPLSRRGVVTVGDAEGFAGAGGAIGFLVVDNKLRFEVNLAACTQAGVTVSSRLLRLATEVRP